MKSKWTASLCVAACALVCAGQARSSDPTKLLDHLTGDWVMKGTISGQQTTHDVQARWILRREYLQIHEVSREKEADGQPAYEAVVLVSWDAKAGEYACLWLDSTAGGALVKCAVPREGGGRIDPVRLYVVAVGVAAHDVCLSAGGRYVAMDDRR